MTIKEKKAIFEQNKKVYEAALLTFHDTNGYSVYNCSLPFTGSDGRRYIYGRVERAEDWINSHAMLFVETGKDEFTRVKDSMMYQLEDPFLQRIHGEMIMGGTHVTKSKGELLNYCGYFYRGDETRMVYFTTGPDLMKDIRLIELANGKIGIFSRPSYINNTSGAKSQIGFTTIDDINELDADVIANAPYLNGLLADGEWGGVNQAYLLESGKIGVIGHMSYEDTDENGKPLLVYVNTAFILDTDTMTVTEPQIIGTKSCFPKVVAKYPRLEDCCFTSGILPREDGKVDLYSGIGDIAEGRIVIDNPFAGEGKITCSL